MALGVLNNLSAIYAENNLNNTNNSLQTVLQQLSSGSKINSGADDAAGFLLSTASRPTPWPSPSPRPTPQKGGPARCGRWSSLSGDQPARSSHHPGHRSLKRHAQLHPGRSSQPGVSVDPGRGQQYRFHNHLQPTAGVHRKGHRRLHWRLLDRRLLVGRFEHSRP